MLKDLFCLQRNNPLDKSQKLANKYLYVLPKYLKNKIKHNHFKSNTYLAFQKFNYLRDNGKRFTPRIKVPQSTCENLI